MTEKKKSTRAPKSDPTEVPVVPDEVSSQRIDALDARVRLLEDTMLKVTAFVLGAGRSFE